eukprot:scaffold145866_cov21-Tisochrysis_lutea.AAC.2
MRRCESMWTAEHTSGPVRLPAWLCCKGEGDGVTWKGAKVRGVSGAQMWDSAPGWLALAIREKRNPHNPVW